MNIRFNSAVARVAAAVCLLGGSSIVGCSGSEDPPIAPGPPGGVSGSSSTAGTPAGGTAAGGSAAGGGGAGGSAGAAAGAGGAPACPGNQIKMPDGMCGCPAYAATFCEAVPKCVNPMKDPDHCGTCGMACGETSACAAGVCTPALTTLGELAGCGTLLLVGAQGKLYALSTMTGDLNAFTLPAGGAPTKVGTVAGGVAFAVDDTNAYVASGMTVKRLALAGGEPTTVVTETTAVKDIAVSGNTLYYGTGTGVKAIAKTATNGTPAATLEALAASQGEPQSVAASGTVLLYASASAQNVERCDTTMSCTEGAGMDLEERGPGHKKIGQSQGGLLFGHGTLQTNGTSVVWVNNGMQSAPIMDATGDYPTKGVGTPIDSGNITAFAVAGMNIYFTEQTSAEPPLVSLEKSTFDSPDPTWLARKVPLVNSIAASGTDLFLASGCNILKAAQ